MRLLCSITRTAFFLASVYFSFCHGQDWHSRTGSCAGRGAGCSCRCPWKPYSRSRRRRAGRGPFSKRCRDRRAAPGVFPEIQDAGRTVVFRGRAASSGFSQHSSRAMPAMGQQGFHALDTLCFFVHAGIVKRQGRMRRHSPHDLAVQSRRSW